MNHLHILCIVLIFSILFTSCSDKKDKKKEDHPPESQVDLNNNDGSKNDGTKNDSDTTKPISLKINADSSTLLAGEKISLLVSSKLSNGETSNNLDNVEWVTSDPDIATISDTGEVTAISMGSVVIQAKLGTLKNTMNLTVLASEIRLTAWAGETDAIIALDDSGNHQNIKLYHSLLSDCEPSACQNALHQNVSESGEITIDLHKLDDTPNYQLTTGDYKSQSIKFNEDNVFSSRKNFNAMVFNNAIYIIGGTHDNKPLNDIWVSETGNQWQTISMTNPFTAIDGQKAAILNGSLFLIGGSPADNSTDNHIWYSADASSWDKYIVTDAFELRESHQIASLDGSIYLIAGWTSTKGCDAFNDVWKTEDGQTWEKQTLDAGFSKRCAHQVTPFNEKLYLIGGRADKDKVKYLNDTWSSSNGKDWTSEADSNAFTPRFKHQVVKFNNALYLSGGFGGTNEPDSVGAYFNDIWKSTDGKTWEVVNNKGNFSPRANHQMIVFNDMLYIIGGNDKTTVFNDVWRSSDGINWRKRLNGTFTLTQQ